MYRFSIAALCLATLFVLVGESHAQHILYVDIDAAGSSDGSSWNDAFTDPRDALSVAQTGDEIWVAEGSYFLRGDSRSTFQLRSGIAMYGGFSGVESQREARDPKRYETILSGNDQDLSTVSVVTTNDTDRTAILDGFTITGGNAGADFMSSPEYTTGGGLFNRGGSPLLRNLVFRENFAIRGGALANLGGNPVLINCIFADNRTQTGGHAYGGAIYTDGGTLTVYNTQFLRNEALGYKDSPRRRTGVGRGGAVFILSGEATLVNTLFVENEVRGEPFTRFSLYEGEARGGAVYVARGAAVTVVNSTFYRNHILEGADVEREGGGLFLAPAFSTDPAALAVIRNSIFWENQLEDVDGTAADISYSIVEGGYVGSHVQAIDPQFNDQYQFGNLSPAVDQGLDTALPADLFDLDNDGDLTERLPVDAFGNQRIAGTSVDLGYFEVQTPLSTGTEPVPGAHVQITAYPNPVHDVITVLVENSHLTDATISLHDALGRQLRIVYQGILDAHGSRSWSVPTRGLASGTYFLRIIQGDHSVEVHPVTVSR